MLVGGTAGETGSMRPYKIDLKTRECTPLGSPILDSGFSLFGDISPDGKTAVVIHMDRSGTASLNFQLCLIDLASGNARLLGKPMDMGYINWAADGQHLVLLTRKAKDINSPMIASLATMDMEGHVTELRRGDSPMLLADRRTILYENTDTNLWHTCDLEGKNDKLYADGLSEYGFPTPAPDGKRILMMHFVPKALPLPVVLQIGEPQGRAITQVEGLWGESTWR